LEPITTKLCFDLRLPPDVNIEMHPVTAFFGTTNEML
jgi:hypothetical protein